MHKKRKYSVFIHFCQKSVVQLIFVMFLIGIAKVKKAWYNMPMN